MLAAASGIRLRIDAPAADVASAYAFQLKYFPVQFGSTERTVIGSVPRSSVVRVQEPAT